MARRRLTRLVCAVLCAVPLVCVQTVARADVIGAEQYIDVVDRRATLDRVDTMLARSDVRDTLERLGVDPDDASERVAALNDRELAVLAEEMDELPAGGLLATIGVVFIVLLILELVGVTNIFSKI